MHPVAIIESKEEIFSADDRPTVAVPVPEWGEGREVLVRAIGGTERDNFEQAIANPNGKGVKPGSVVRARLCSIGIVNSKGERLFDLKDMVKLGEKNTRPLDRIYEKIAELSGINQKGKEALEKNSKPAQSDDSTSSSPAT